MADKNDFPKTSGKSTPKSGVAQDFARLMKNLRSENNLTQSDLSQRSGVSLRMISDMERGLKQPTLITLIKLARGYNMPRLKFMERILNSMKE